MAVNDENDAKRFYYQVADAVEKVRNIMKQNSMDADISDVVPVVNFLENINWENNQLGVIDGILLYALVKYVCQKKLDGRIVEIGTWNGHSLSYMAWSLKHMKSDEKIDSIDIDYQGNFQDKTRISGVNEFTATKEDSKIVGGKWNNSIKLLFIDGCHDYDYVVNDFQLFEKHIVKGGIVVFHDVCEDKYKKGSPSADPSLAFKEYVSNNPDYSNQTIIESGEGIAFAVKR